MAGWLITLGGIGTIVAVSGVCIFLVYVVVPLFQGSDIRLWGARSVQAAGVPARWLWMALDEYQTLGWAYAEDGTLKLFRLDTCEVLESRRLFSEVPTSHSFSVQQGEAAFGFADGSIRLGKIGFETSFLSTADVPAGFDWLSAGAIEFYQDGVVQRTPEGQFRAQRLQVEMEDPVPMSPGHSVVQLDVSTRADGPVIAALSSDGILRIRKISRRKNLLTGKVTVTMSGGEVTLVGGVRPVRLMLAGVADTVSVICEDGTLMRFDVRAIDRPELVETVMLGGGNATAITAIAFLLGKTTLMVGDSAGRVRGWFRVKPRDYPGDGSALVPAKELAAGASSVTALAPSARGRTLAVGYADGSVRLFYVTSQKLLAEGKLDPPAPIETLAISPKDDAIVAEAGGRIARWVVRAPHPETTLASIFSPVWYEGYEKPEHVWQSAGGTDDFEPKFGLIPLIYGTIKATVYSMLFGAPLALLAAFFTSEFLHPRTRARVKPAIEMMASLPSVVLGFLAALVIAPFVEGIVTEVLTMFVTVPFTFCLGGYFWQMLSQRRRNRLAKYRLVWIAALLPFGISVGWLLGPAVERTFFGGDIKAWLDGQAGTGTGGWMMILLPLSVLAVALAFTSWINPRLERLVGKCGRFKISVLELGKFLIGAAATVIVALAASWMLTASGWDPRGTFVDTYVQRNALVVGFVMGFAVIPIIYTIAEDALSSVPEHLRSGSLALGATPWQTGVHVILPTAMSGIFSAVMIGLGRAVGETMIVLMAAGNTPVLEWNIFNGFRTLSANIAVELPEAVQNSTHFRMLFLSALVLFGMTFLLNTVAEAVRLRFRRRAYQL